MLMAHFKGNEVQQFQIMRMSDQEIHQKYIEIFEWRRGYGQFE